MDLSSEEEKTPILHSSYHGSGIDNSGVQKCSEADDEAVGSKMKVYKWRWVVLAVFVANLSINNAIWISISPIADVAECYYDTTKFWVNTFSMVYMATYTLFIVPSAWLLGHVRLRTVLVIASCLNAAGACLRVAGSGPTDGSFWVLLTGQTVASLCNLLLWGTPSYVAGVWFPASERGTAAAILGALAPQLGVVTSYILGPLLVRSHHTKAVCDHNSTADSALSQEWTNEIYDQMLYYNSGQAGASLLLLIVTLVAVPNAPPTPPSPSQKLLENSSYSEKYESFLDITKAVLTNNYFLLLLITASINLGAAGATVSLFNELIHPFFENRDQDVVFIGITAQIPAMITVFVVGPILSTTKAFYAMNVVLYIIAFLSISTFLAAIEFIPSFYVLYPIVAVIGSSVTGFQAIAYEYAAEMTFPLQEGISGGLVNWVSQPMSILMIVVGAKFVTVNGRPVPVAWTIAALTLIGAIITIFIRPELRKTKIDSKKKKPSINKNTLS